MTIRRAYLIEASTESAGVTGITALIPEHPSGLDMWIHFAPKGHSHVVIFYDKPADFIFSNYSMIAAEVTKNGNRLPLEDFRNQPAQSRSRCAILEVN